MAIGPNTSHLQPCGIDEAGRGPLAGPVTAAAVVLPTDFPVEQLNDSKKLNARARERLRSLLIAAGVPHGIAHASHEEIDRLNIHHATLLAMTRAWEALRTAYPATTPHTVIVDGKFCPDVPLTCHAIVDGDATEPAIMAASILAKTERDRIMTEYHRRWPQYGFDRNMGYPTAAHRAAIRTHGPAPIHRRSFKGVVVAGDRGGGAAPDRLGDADDDAPVANAP